VQPRGRSVRAAASQAVVTALPAVARGGPSGGGRGRARFAPFLADYTRIRQAEQRGSDDPAYHLGLPDCPPDHPIAAQWALRRRTLAAFTRRLLPRLGSGLRIVDLRWRREPSCFAILFEAKRRLR
jgi:hypothetical protein